MTESIPSTIPTCVNHPDVETRLACSTCGDPICTRCMRQGAVGQKCPRCAKVPRSARGVGKPRHYVQGIAVGLAVAIVGGVLAAYVRGPARFFGFIISMVLGYAIGRAISWGVQRQTATPFVAIAAIMGGLGGWLSYGLALRPFALIGIVIAALMSVSALRR